MKGKQEASKLGWRFLLSVILGALLLAGCGGEAKTDVTLYKGENWQAIMELAIPSQLLGMAGGEAALENELRSSLREKPPDIEVSWHREYEGQNVVYHFTLKGRGWDKLNEAIFDGGATIVGEDGKVHITYPIPWGSELTISTLTLRGGKIVSSNADEVTNGSAIWYNPTGTIEAVLTEKSRINWPVILLIALGVSMVGGAIAFLTRRQPSEAGAFIVEESVCPRCGTVNPPGAKFCKHCGAKLPP